MDSSKITLLAANGVQIHISRAACDRLNTIKAMIEDLGADAEIPLDISEPVLREVVEYAEYRVANPIDAKFLERKPGPSDPCDIQRFADLANTRFTRGANTTNATGSNHPRGYVENPHSEVDPLGVSRPVHYPVNIDTLLITANYLDFQELLMGVARTIASRLRDKDVNTLRAEWDIRNDLTPEEEAKIRAENEWFDEKSMPPIPTIEEIKRQVAAAHADIKKYEAQRAEALKQKPS